MLKSTITADDMSQSFFTKPQLAYLLALHRVNGLGPVRLQHLLNNLKDPQTIWQTSVTVLRNLGIPQTVLDNLALEKKQTEPLAYAEKVFNSGISILTLFDQNYPERLKQIYQPPIILYIKGEITGEDKHSLAVVGTRKITAYGRLVTETLVTQIVEKGLTVVSGLARGVDGVAHKTALDCGGRTIAVLGGGLWDIYPKEHEKLVEKISENGAVISQFPPDFASVPGNFPARNRIVAGLSLGVLVTEAAEDSGSLITARFALEEGREVFAVPGPVTTASSLGTLSLIKEGAKLVIRAEDIFEELGLGRNTFKIKVPDLSALSELEKLVLTCLDNEQKHIDEICRETKRTTQEISSSLIKLEIAGLIQNMGQGSYLKLAS